MAIVTLADTEVFTAIRHLLSLSLTAAALPDATIFAHPFFKRAVREVAAVVPDAETATGEKRQSILAAIEFRTAAELIMTLSEVVSESFLNVSRRWAPRDRDKMKADYMNAYHDELASAVPGYDNSASLSFFDVISSGD